MTVGFSFDDQLEYVHRSLVRKGPVRRREDSRLASYNSFALDTATIAACPIQFDDVRLPLGHRA